MKKSAIILLLLCIGMTSCSSPKKVTSSSESVSETIAATEITPETTAAITTDEAVSETTVTTTAVKAIKIKREDISDYVYEGETQTVGNDTYGYLDISYDWEYKEQDAHQRPIMDYVDGEENEFTMINCDIFGWGISHKNIDDLAELYDYSGSFKDAEVTKYDVDGYTAYKLTCSRLSAVNAVNYDDYYVAHWIFECEDGINRAVIFRGTEDFIEGSDNIIKTYHLYN